MLGVLNHWRRREEQECSAEVGKVKCRRFGIFWLWDGVFLRCISLDSYFLHICILHRVCFINVGQLVINAIV